MARVRREGFKCDAAAANTLVLEWTIDSASIHPQTREHMTDTTRILQRIQARQGKRGFPGNREPRAARKYPFQRNPWGKSHKHPAVSRSAIRPEDMGKVSLLTPTEHAATHIFRTAQSF